MSQKQKFGTPITNKQANAAIKQKKEHIKTVVQGTHSNVKDPDKSRKRSNTPVFDCSKGPEQPIPPPPDCTNKWDAKNKKWKCKSCDHSKANALYGDEYSQYDEAGYGYGGGYVGQSDRILSDKYYDGYGSYDHYNSDYALIIAMASIIFIGCCCIMIIVSIIGGFVSGKFYEKTKNTKSGRDRYKYVNVNEEQV